MGAGDFTPQTVRYAFFVRAVERCERCRRRLTWERRGLDWSAHHRRPRGMGGTSDPRVASIANAGILCGNATTPGSCHEWAEKNREQAIADGWLIPRAAPIELHAPDTVRVKDMAGLWWLFTDTGRAVEVDGGNER